MAMVFIVFSGYNERAVIAFLRVLKRYKIACHIVANGNTDRILCTQFAGDVSFVRPDPELTRESAEVALDSVVVAGCGARLILAPSTEAINRFFLANPDLLYKRGIELPLVDSEMYCRISDKRSFGDLCRSCGISVPEEDLDPESCSLPFVAKPISYELSAPVVPKLVLTESDRVELLQSLDYSKFYFQQFVNGRSIYLLLHLSRGGAVCAFSQENLIQQPDGKSIIAAVPSDFHLTEAARPFVEMLIQLQFHGLVMIEVRVNESGCYMIEANPRFWGPSQLFVDAMPFDLFDAFLSDVGFEGIAGKDLTRGEARYFWFDGLLSTLKSGRSPVFHHYDAKALAADFSKWIASDIYLRGDTLNIFSLAFGGNDL